MKFAVAEKPGPHGLLLVVTDEDILEKRFSDGKLQLDLSNAFYRGETKTREEVIRLFCTAQHLHLTGKHSVAIGVEKDYVKPLRILWVQGIPHAEVVVEQG